jgi:hypothetical protein
MLPPARRQQRRQLARAPPVTSASRMMSCVLVEW